MRASSRFPPSLLPPFFFLLCALGRVKGAEVGAVTCGSVLKLLNTRHNVRLHSHEVKYGSGENIGTGRKGVEGRGGLTRRRNGIGSSIQ